MYIELVELLRCIRAHDESWLVASIDDLRERSIHRGKLGCPVCQAEYAIVEGTADFSGAMVSPAVASGASDPADIALRAGAFLGLADAPGTVMLGGSWAGGAAILAESTGARVFAANAFQNGDANAVGRILVNDLFPFSQASCAGVALDGTFRASAVENALKILRPGGRLVAPASLLRPRALRLLAEDDEWWVGEKAPEVTTLRRGNR